MGGMAGTQHQPGIRQQGACRETANHPVKAGTGPYRNIIDFKRDAPLQGVNQAQALVVVSGLAITETPDHLCLLTVR
jgi:hypothetical protein